MTTHDEHDNDSSLKSYLEGKDGVSATYRKVAGEMPPAELDALILQAAAGAVAKPAAQPGASRRQQYAMAASLGLGVLLTSLYYEQQMPQDTGPLIITASVDQRQVGELDFAASKAADAVVANGGVADAGVVQAPVQAEVAQADVARAENFLASAATAVSPQAAQPAPQSAAAQIVVNEGQVAGARRPPPATRASDTLARTEVAGMAELLNLVEQARLTATDTSAELRAQDLWLEEIIRIASELESSASETEALRQRLEAERASFSAIYPDFDIDAALAE